MNLRKKLISSKTRIESHPELKEVLSLIKRLRDQKVELRNEADQKGSGSLAYRKYNIIERLLSDIDKIINVYNVKKPPKGKSSGISDENQDLKEFISVVNKLLTLVKQKQRTGEVTLSAKRNDKKSYARQGVSFVTQGVIIGLTSVFSTSVPLTFSTSMSSKNVSNKINEMIGLDDDLSTSARLLVNLTNALENVHAILQQDLTVLKKMNISQDPDDEEYIKISISP